MFVLAFLDVRVSTIAVPLLNMLDEERLITTFRTLRGFHLVPAPGYVRHQPESLEILPPLSVYEHVFVGIRHDNTLAEGNSGLAVSRQEDVAYM